MLLALLLLAVSCESDRDTRGIVDGMTVELNISTRAITSTSKTYEVGSTWENYIDIEGGDYRIYFFTNDKNDATASSNAERNTLIAEFQPLEMTAVEGSDYTQYTLSGAVDKVMAEYPDFKIVVLANWRTYPDVTAGTTTIDDLVEGENSTFTAETFHTTDGVNSTHLIPFFGVREYSGVSWRDGWRTVLSGDITLLRALAKVEVVITEDSEIDSFDSVSIVRYNTSGYCAPKGVYKQSDYDHNYTWDEDFTSSLHLVGGGNGNLGLITHTFNQQSGTDTDTWTIYLPEYDNTSTSSDCSFIRVTIDGNDYQIYFANYDNGEAENTADYDIFRNYLYRFSVKVLANHTIEVSVNKWEDLFDNEYKFNYDEDESGDDDN